MALYPTKAPIDEVLKEAGMTREQFEDGLDEREQIKFDIAYHKIVAKYRAEEVKCNG